MSAQTPQQCKNVDTSKWMYNDQDQTPCQVLSSSLRQFDTTFNLTWLDLSFACPQGSNHTNTTTTSSSFSRELSDYCCSSVSFSLFSSCWACQWDQPVAGHVRTTWGNYSSPCLSNSTAGASRILAATTRIGTLSSAVQSALTAANINIPNWAFLPVTNNSTWDELAAQSNATAMASSSTAIQSNQLSNGAIAGISIGSFIAFCTLVFIFTIMCMRQKQRHRLETFRHRSASIFGHKKRVINLHEKTLGAKATRGAQQENVTRVDLAALDDDGLVSPASVEGGGMMMGAHTVDIISHDATMHPGFLGAQTRRMETPGSGVGGFPRSERPESGLGLGVAARFQTNVRRSLARLGRRSQPERADGNPQQSQSQHGLEHTTSTSNRHTHPMTQISSLDGHPSFAVPFFPSDQMQSANTSGRLPPSSWPTGAFDTSTAHPLTQQQLHPQLSRNPSVVPPSPHQLSAANKATPMPLTKEALSLARVAQDGTLFVLGEPELRHGSGKTRGSANEMQSRSVQPQQQQQEMVRTVSLERNPVQMYRHADVLPGRSDSLRRSQMHPEPQRQGQLGLVLHEAVMDGTVPRRKIPSRQRQLEDRGEGTSAQRTSTSRTTPPVELGLGAATSASQPTTSQRGLSTFIGSLRGPIARKAVPKSDSSVVANAGSAMGSNGELSYVDEDDDSIAALGTRYIGTSATGTSGSTGTGSGNRRGGRRNGKKRGRESRDMRLSLVPTSPSSGNVGGVKSDGTRTPSPKVAPSAEWFDLFRRGTVPITGGSRGEGESSAGERKTDLARTKTAPVPGASAGGSMANVPGPSRTGGGGPLSPNQKRQAFQPNASAGPSMSTFERTHSADSAAALYPKPVGALYPSAAASFLSSLAGPSSAPSSSTVQRQSSTQNVPETAAPAWTNPTTTSRSTATVQPSLARALPPVSPPSAYHHDPPSGSQPVSLPSVYQTQPSLVSNLSHNTSTAPHSQRQSQRPLSSAPLPVAPAVPISFTTVPPPRAVPAGARPIRRLPAIPPQPPPL